MITSILSAIIIGAIIGVLGRLALHGKQNISILATVVVGIVAALIGTFIAGILSVGDTNGADWIEFVIQVVLTAIGVSIFAGASRTTGRPQRRVAAISSHLPR